MTDLKNKIKKTVDQTTQKAKKAIKESDIENKLKDAASKAKEAAVQANDKLEKSGVKEKIANTVNEENTKLVKEKAGCVFSKAAEIVKNNKKCLIKVLAALVGLFVLVKLVCFVFGGEKTLKIEKDGITEEITYFIDSDKVFGEMLNLPDQSKMALTTKKFYDGIFSYKVKSVIAKDIYTHRKSGISLNDTSYIVRVINPILGNTIAIVFKEFDFVYQDQDVTGYYVFTFDESSKYIDKEPTYKLVYTKYFEKESKSK